MVASGGVDDLPVLLTTDKAEAHRVAATIKSHVHPHVLRTLAALGRDGMAWLAAVSVMTFDDAGLLAAVETVYEDGDDELAPA